VQNLQKKASDKNFDRNLVDLC